MMYICIHVGISHVSIDSVMFPYETPAFDQLKLMQLINSARFAIDQLIILQLIN